MHSFNFDNALRNRQSQKPQASSPVSCPRQAFALIMAATGKANLAHTVDQGCTTATDPSLNFGDYTDGEMGSRPTPDDWEKLRPIFTSYYFHGSGLPLRAVRDIMAREYGFNASERMYKQRVKEWNLWKNRHSTHSTHSNAVNTPSVEEANPRRHSHPAPTVNGGRVSRRRMSSPGSGLRTQGRRRRRSSTSTTMANKTPVEEEASLPSNELTLLENDEGFENSVGPLNIPRRLEAPENLKILEDILNHIDRYYLSYFRGQDRLFSDPALGSVGMGAVGLDDGFTDKGLLEIHDPGYAAISLAKSKQYREARILLGEAQDKVKGLLRAQHPSLLPFILEIICENSTTPEFNVPEWFRQYVRDLCSIIMGKGHSLTMILHLLGLVDHKLETCAMILRKIQAVLSTGCGASEWVARRPVKVYCRVLRHLGRYDEVEQILPTSMGVYGSLEPASQSELLGLLYELAWLTARGRRDYSTASDLFNEILLLTDHDAKAGQISHFRVKAQRGLGVLAREECRHHLSQQYFAAALQQSRYGFGERDSNTVRISSELEEALRKLGRTEEADQLRRERDELFVDEGGMYGEPVEGVGEADGVVEVEDEGEGEGEGGGGGECEAEDEVEHVDLFTHQGVQAFHLDQQPGRYTPTMVFV